MANIHFIIKCPGTVKEKLNNSKEFTIFLAYRFGRNTSFQYKTGHKVPAKFWNFEKFRVRNVTEFLDKDKINNHLNELQTVTESFITDLKISNKEVTPAELKNFLNNHLHPRPTNENTFFGHCQKFVDNIDSRINEKTGQLISYKTKRDYIRTVQLLKEYQKAKRKQIDFKDIDLDFYQDFTEFLQNGAKTKKDEVIKMSTNTISHKIQSLKAILNDATDKGINTNLFFKNPKFKTIKEESENIYLTEKELNILEKHDFSDNDRLDKVRDLFLFGAWTGLRFSDFTRVTPDNINSDGYITIRQQKTGNVVSIPLHPTVKKLWIKYSGKLPRTISNQKFNDYIKEVCEDCEINEPCHKGMTKGGQYISTKFEKWQLVSSHTARRSFATNLLKSGYSALGVMKITGHKTEQAFMKYIKLESEDYAKMLDMHWKQNTNVLKVV